MFRNWPIGRKLMLVVAMPLVVIVVLATALVRPKLATANAANANLAQSRLATANMQFRDEVQVERAASLQFLADSNATPQSLAEVRTAFDAKRDLFLKVAGETKAGSPQQALAITATIAVTMSYDALRKRVDARAITPQQLHDVVTKALEAHSALVESLETTAANVELLGQTELIVSLLEAKDSIANVGSLMGLRLDAGSLSMSSLAEVTNLVGQERLSIENFLKDAQPTLVALYRNIENKPEFTDSDTKLAAILQSEGTAGRTPVRASDWWKSADSKLAEMDSVEDAVFNDYVAVAKGLASQARNEAIRYTVIAGLSAIIAVAAAFAMARSISGRLAGISAEANSIATDRLPEVLSALRNPSAEALAGALPHVTVDARDEIGVMGESFNTVLRTAVETSISHSQRRAKTLTDILVNLGRRNQALIELQLAQIDELEQKYQDPELLEGLFSLDHMITSMRRNAENLLVLASDKQARVWTDPVPMLDVLRGALAEIRDMSRIELNLASADNALITGGFAVDLSHLVAELVDNAIAFSPPTAPVNVSAERIGSDIRVWVLDRGIGMSDSEYEASNDRVTNPPDIDDLATDRVGYQVVGRLARRLGVAVQIQANPGGGTAASISVPFSLIHTASHTTAEAMAAFIPEASAVHVPASQIDPGVPTAASGGPLPLRFAPAATPFAAPTGPPAASPPPDRPAVPPSATTTSGLQRRVPGTNYVGDEKAIEFDSGQFRRFPQTGRSTGWQSDDLAKSRLEAIGSMQRSSNRAREDEPGEQSAAPVPPPPPPLPAHRPTA